MPGKAKLVPKSLLSSDERVVFESRPSALKYMVSGSLVMVIGLAALVMFAWKWIPDAPSIPYLTEQLEGDYGQYIEWVLIGVFVLALLYFATKWLRWGSTVYAITDERIITQKGILNKVYDDVPLNQITNVDVSQSIGKRMVGYGTIVFSTTGSAGRKDAVRWEWVPHPVTVRRKLQEVMDIRVKPKQ